VQRETIRIFDAFRDSTLAERFREVEILGREVPMLLRDATGQVYRGSIDLLYRAREGEVVVADYKTDALDDDDTLTGRYRRQLEIYADAVRLALDLPRRPRTELWLLGRTPPSRLVLP
jgi:ATP-dependent exoDNAse (exonuclease V) beta subunit